MYLREQLSRWVTAAVVSAFGVAALSGCATPFSGIPPTPAAGSASGVPQSHHHGGSGPEERLFTKYGGPVNVVLRTQPKELQAGQPYTITYALNDSDSMPMTIEKLRITHERPMHLIRVSRDLDEFAHIHPEDQGEGRYTVTDTLPTPGQYVLYNEFMRWDGIEQIERHEISTAGGEAGADAALTPDLGETKEIDGLRVALKAGSEKVRRRAEATFTLTVEKDGQPVQDLEPYLGAAAHVVLISADTTQFAHTHGVVAGTENGHHAAGHDMEHAPPERFGPEVQFTHTFMQPGLYRIWVQIEHAGKVVTIPYDVDVLK